MATAKPQPAPRPAPQPVPHIPAQAQTVSKQVFTDFASI